jgi:WD40 repeat protein
VWDARTGLLWAEPLRLHDPVDSAQFSPDGTRLLVLSNQTVSVWNLQNRGMVAGRLQTDDTNNDMDSPMALSPDAKEIATTYVVNKTTYSSKGYTEEQSGAAQVWDVQTGLPINGLLPVGRLTDVQFSPDSKLLATASMDNSARVWDAQTGRPLTKPLLHDRDVRSVAFSPDSRLLVTASWDQTARVWDAASGRLITTLKGNSTLEKAWFSLDGKKVITVTLEDVAQVWDAQTGAALLALNQNTERSGSILSEDKRWFLGKLDASHWQIWNLDSGTLFSRFPPPDPDAQQQQFSPDGRELLATGGNDAWLLDTQTGDQLIDPLPHPDAVTSAKFSPDGQCIITSCQDGMARIWDAHNGQLLADPFKPAEDVTSAQFSPDGRGILTISTSDPGSAIGNIPGFWDFVPSQTPVPDWFPPLAEAVGGEVLDQQGVIQPTTIDRVALLSRIRQTLAHSAATDDWTVWGRWFLADPSTRLISPFSKITVPQQIEQCLKQNTLPSLDEAARLSLGNAVLSRRISDARKALGPQNQ